MLISRDHCPVCKSADFSAVYRLSFSDPALRSWCVQYYRLEKQGFDFDGVFGEQEFILNSCRFCSAIFQENIPNEEFANILYGTWIDGESAGARRISSRQRLDNLREAAAAVALVTGDPEPMAGADPLRVLDYGAGWGGWSSAMHFIGCAVSAVELSAARRAHLQRSGITLIDDGNLGVDAFHYINTEQVFEHLPDPASIFRQLVDALAPGGVLKVSVPFSWRLERGKFDLSWERGLKDRKYIMACMPFEHINYFRRPSLQNLARSHSLEEVFFPQSVERRIGRAQGGLIMSLIRNAARPWVRRHLRHFHLFRKPGGQE